MSLLDMITRAEFIFKKYEKYTREENRERLVGADAFTELCLEFASQVQGLLEKAGQAERERNRTAVAQLNAEIRREKAKLRDQLPDLVKASKKKAKRLAPEKKEERKAKIAALEEQLEGVPDGTAHERRKKAQDQAGPIHINLDVNNMRLNPLSMEHSDESEAFRGEFVRSRQKQDEGLDQISKGLRVLKDLSSALSDELKKQDPLLESIDTKTAANTAELRSANGKLKKLLLEMRKPHKLCLDFILIAVALGLGAYIFSILKPNGGSSAKNAITSKISSVF